MRFVLIDEFLELERGRRAVARKTFRRDDEVFRDHFPGWPVVPGSLLIEAMGQTGGWLLALEADPGRWPLLVLVEGAKFRRFVAPEEEIRIEAVPDPTAGAGRVVRARARVEGRRVAEAHLVYREIEPQAERLEELERWTAATFLRLAGRPWPGGRGRR